jgi:hypothetical protein
MWGLSSFWWFLILTTKWAFKSELSSGCHIFPKTNSNTWKCCMNSWKILLDLLPGWHLFSLLFCTRTKLFCRIQALPSTFLHCNLVHRDLMIKGFGHFEEQKNRDLHTKMKIFSNYSPIWCEIPRFVVTRN